MSSVGSDIGFDPAVQALLEDFDPRASSRLTGSERVAEYLAAAGLITVVALLAALSPGHREFSLPLAAALTCGYAALSRIEFQVGAGYTVPTQLVFVPMLFAVPLPAVPIMVATGLLVGH